MATPLNQTIELLGKVQQLGADAFEALERGATVNQITESFERMNEAIWQTPSLLEDMSQASRGTISDFDAMRGLMMLTAGASDELSQAFADAAPRLLEIAKAAQKFNPTLGDTAFIYESLTTGIKRGSTLMIDNSGITLTAGEAYALFAEKVGKAANALSAEEQKMAVLELTMERGGKLIEQVGGNLDSASDAYARLGVIASDTADSVKSGFAEAIAPYMDDIVESAENIGPALVEAAAIGIPAMVNLANSMPQYIDKAGAAIERTEDFIEVVKFLTTPIRIMFVYNEYAIDKIKTFVDWLSNDPMIQKLFGTGPVGHVEAPFDPVVESAIHAQAALEPIVQSLADSEEATSEYGKSAETTAEQLAFLYAVSQDVGQATDDLGVTFEDVAEAELKRKETAESLTAALEEQARVTRELSATSGDLFTEAVANQEDPEYEFNLDDELYAQADAAGASAEALAMLKLATGEFTEEQAIAALKMVAVNEAIRQQAEALAEMGEAVTPEAIEQARKNIQTIINTFSESDAKVTITPVVKEDPEFVKKMEEMFGADPSAEGGARKIPVGVDTSQAKTDIDTFIADDIGPYFEEPYEVTVDAVVEGARDNINEIITLLDSIDRVIEVVVNVSASIDEELDDYV